MQQKRPVNLNLSTIKFPVPAIVSILHRISGFLLFFAIPFFLWLLQQSLSSADGFAQVEQIMSNFFVKFITWAFLSALIYHLLAGVRHLLMDLGLGETLKKARATALVMLVISIICILWLGYWLW